MHKVSNKSIEDLFLIECRKMGLYACNEVDHYDHRSDILGVNYIKKEIYEFEFKRSSHDLKVAEKKKEKYKSEKIKRQYHYKYKRMYKFAGQMPRPHRFYYVVPVELWLKEKEYFMQDKNAGVYVWTLSNRKDWNGFRDKEESKELQYVFRSVKKVRRYESNLQKYEVALRNICSRATSRILNLI